MALVTAEEKDDFFKGVEAAAKKAIWCAVATVKGTDQATKDPVWDVMDCDLAQFSPGGKEEPGFCAIKIAPSRVKLSAMFGTMNKRVWKLYRNTSKITAGRGCP
jgi:general stress protein 26